MSSGDPIDVMNWGLKWFWRIMKVLLCFLLLEILVAVWLVVALISKAGGEKVWSFINTVRGKFGF